MGLLAISLLVREKPSMLNFMRHDELPPWPRLVQATALLREENHFYFLQLQWQSRGGHRAYRSGTARLVRRARSPGHSLRGNSVPILSVCLAHQKNIPNHSRALGNHSSVSVREINKPAASIERYRLSSPPALHPPPPQIHLFFSFI